MSDTTTTPAEGTPEAVTGPDDFGAFERWRETGELPKEESAAAASGEGDGEPEPGGETEKPKENDRENEGEDEGEEKPRKGGFQRKIDRLTREKYEMARRLEALESRLADKPAGEAKAQPKAASAERPKSAEFDDYDEFLDALADWKVDQKLAAARSAEAEAAAREAQAAVTAEWHARLDEYRAATPGFDEALEASETVFPPVAQQAIVESELGPALAYHLATHPEEAARIAALPPVAAVRALGKLEAKLDAKASTPEKPKPKAASAAPAPVKPVSGGGRSVDLNDPELPFDEWERQRNAQLRAA